MRGGENGIIQFIIKLAKVQKKGVALSNYTLIEIKEFLLDKSTKCL